MADGDIKNWQKITLVLLINILTSMPLLAQNAQDSSHQLKQVILAASTKKAQMQKIRPKLLALLKLSKESPQLINTNLKDFIGVKPTLNTAEKFLLAIIKARLAHYQGKTQQVIKLLLSVEPLEKFIAKTQLDQPEFFAFDLLLSQSYEKLKDFDKAYEYKRNYLHKYARYTENQKKHIVEALTQKYQMEKMLKENALLAEQNIIEHKKIQQVKELKSNQKRNNLILISIGITFVVLMFRQYRIRQKLIRLSRTDALTGLVNRKTLFYLGEQLHKKAVTQSLVYSVVYFDCDHFKKINDEYGHQVGDKVLQIITKLGQEVIRTRDIFARLGGEEFTLVLPDEDLSKAKAVAEHLRAKIADYNFSALGIKSKVTASFGVASLNDCNIKNFDQLINLADAAMFKAKKLGRNKVICGNNLAEQTLFEQDENQPKLTIRST
jgi:diguanylate cyclase (GGDEF)-like protein